MPYGKVDSGRKPQTGYEYAGLSRPTKPNSGFEYYFKDVFTDE